MNKTMTFIAEIGLNHNGNFGLLFELIKQASLSGADIAKFQLGWRSGENEINDIGTSEIELIIDCCLYNNIEPMFSIFNENSLSLIEKFHMNSFKIASKTVKEKPDLAKKIIKKGKKTFISLGMWSEPSFPFGKKINVEYLWCKSEYPAYPWKLADLPKNFLGTNISGYSDHSVGIEVPLMAIVRGATIIEKHFTLDKSDVTIRDHALSATPVEFRQMVEIGRNIKKNIELGV